MYIYIHMYIYTYVYICMYIYISHCFLVDPSLSCIETSRLHHPRNPSPPSPLLPSFSAVLHYSHMHIRILNEFCNNNFV
jgi:hypothetical protein